MGNDFDRKLFDRDSCPVASTMSLIGGKWKLVILYAIYGGINRFGAIRKEIPGLSKKMLTKELRELEHDGLIERIVFPEIPPHVEYKLTAKGASLEKVTDALRDWGAEWLMEKDEATVVEMEKAG